jgi:type I restriction enzyme S subunit
MEVREPGAKYLVRPAFKRTDLGLIPVDWELKTLGSIAGVGAGSTPSRKVDAYWGGHIPWVTTAQIDFNEIGETTEHITELGLQNSAVRLLTPGTLLMALYGQGKTRGKVAKLGIEATTNQACASIAVGRSASAAFVFHCLASQYESIRKLSNSGSQDNLNGQIVKSIRVPLPPNRAEQEAIAEALSDADALIESLEQLLAKKRQIKQGAMQELLTGQRRLPGFGDSWEVQRLGSLLTIRHGKSQSEVESASGAYPILATGGQIGWSDSYLSEGPSVLIGRKGTIDRPQYMDSPFWTVDTLFYSEVHKPNSARFLFYRFCLVDWQQYNEASGVPSLNARTIEGVEILCPGSAEQTAIATTLSDMDAEITALQARLAKARQLKQGMAQALLTGRIRLV